MTTPYFTTGPTPVPQQDGSTRYFNGDGKLHRKNGPAVEFADGTKHWYFKGVLHRVGGPAIEKTDGTKQWWENGTLHRTDGPAMEWPNGRKDWFLNGQKVSESAVRVVYFGRLKLIFGIGDERRRNSMGLILLVGRRKLICRIAIEES